MASSIGSDARAAEPTAADFDNVETGDKAAKPKGKFAAHKQSIIVIASVFGVLLAYLTYRKLASGSAAGASATTTAGTAGNVAGTDTSATQSADQSSALEGFATYLSNMSNELSGLESTVTTQGGQINQILNPVTTVPPGGASTNPPPKSTVFGGAKTGISAVIKNFTTHSDPKQAAGANQVLADLNPNMSAAQQRAQAEKVISNYSLHNQTGLYSQQIQGAQAALAKLG